MERERAGESSEHANPVSVAEILELIQPLEPGLHDMVAFTGGEPLLQPEAVGALARALADAGPERLLETHGLHRAALLEVIASIDVVSMDWKLTSDVRRASDPARGSVAEFHEAHTAFLDAARTAPRVVVKIVVTPATEDAEFDRALACVAETHPDAQLVVQPVTPMGGVRERPTAERLLALARRAEAKLAHVRLIPQTHPIHGAR